ncbi:LOW QUALITY PROTEIN: regulator of G-protein signaling protein-like [Terrapene carolina triunguis]|uniref:LOW QUALITY PROTEIN: regulator of G-protein signaling protein-like n=1 Tax=Terrapene triunguis TaxID=2587831 RepID=UPI000E77B9FF|nr:LOW QUALITY PROTEIN: regulator of G-protein signaling protein-like [Terrapene carolina triunguis]
MVWLGSDSKDLKDRGNSSPTLATIASTELVVLLEDEVFVDFFNTFLNLPVFGQTPIYMANICQWFLWPELPCYLVPKYKGLLTWMEKYRLPHFCKTNLCFHYILCQELLSFIRSEEAAEMLKWKSADQWLLEKCISGSRGMWRFRSFIQGMAGDHRQLPSYCPLLPYVSIACAEWQSLHLDIGICNGEELAKFWLAAERILEIDESDVAQRDLYLSLLQVLRATHLQEGSTVVTLCSMSIESLLKISGWHPQHISTRRELLSEMQKVALFKIQSYWLPNFFIHCKLNMEKEEACQPLLWEYQERLLQVGSKEKAVSPAPTMSIRNSQATSEPYSSKKAKEQIWDLVTCGRQPKETEKHRRHGLQPEGQPSSDWSATSLTDTKQPPPKEDALGKTSVWAQHPERGVKDMEKATSFKTPSPNAQLPLQLEEIGKRRSLSDLRTSTPIAQLPSLLALKKIVKSSSSLDFLPWALNADSCAGRPFRKFLRSKNYAVETHLLDLWHDLEDFLCMVLSSSKGGSFLLRHLMGERICEIYLTESNHQHLPLKPNTLRNLQDLLPSGEVIPWILKAQEEICKILSFFYNDFLADDDETFLRFVSQRSKIQKPVGKQETYGKDEHLLLAKRINESLTLSQALYGVRDFETLSEEHWRFIATQDLTKGGSIQVELEPIVHKTDYRNMTFEELSLRNPSMAVEVLSEDYELFCSMFPSLAFDLEYEERKCVRLSKTSLSLMKRETLMLRKPSLRPRYLMEVLHNPVHLEFFRQFLKQHNAEAPLLFWQAVEKLNTESNPKAQRALINSILKNFFHNKVPAEELLQCQASIIRDIPKAGLVTSSMLFTAQSFVLKAMEEKWFKMYQDLYPGSDIFDTHLVTRQGRGSFIKDKLKRVWFVLQAFIRSICMFRREMNNRQSRKDFEDFLRRELVNQKENLPSSSMRSTIAMASPRQAVPAASTGEDVEVIQVKRRLFNQRHISINFLVNDLSFYLEIEKFCHLADSAAVLAACGLYTERDVTFLKTKVATITKLFLNSEVAPKLRVNISEGQKDLIRNLVSKGVLDRSLYHVALLNVFPVLIHFWKRYCNWKAMESFRRYPKIKKKLSPLPAKASPRTSSIFSGEDYPIIRFTLLKGIQLLLPQPREEVDSSTEQKSSSGSLNWKKPPSGICVTQQIGQQLQDASKKPS